MRPCLVAVGGTATWRTPVVAGPGRRVGSSVAGVKLARSYRGGALLGSAGFQVARWLGEEGRYLLRSREGRSGLDGGKRGRTSSLFLFFLAVELAKAERGGAQQAREGTHCSLFPSPALQPTPVPNVFFPLPSVKGALVPRGTVRSKRGCRHSAPRQQERKDWNLGCGEQAPAVGRGFVSRFFVPLNTPSFCALCC